MITPTTRPKARDDLLVRNRPGDHAILDETSGHVHVLNPTAMAIWQACDGDTTVGEIAEAVSELAGLDLESALQMALETIESFNDSGLLG